MKLHITLFVSLLALCNAEADPEARYLRRPGAGARPFGGEGPGGPGRGDGDGTSRPEGGQSASRLEAMINSQCPTFACNGENAQTLDCTFASGDPERPDVTGLDEDRKAELRAQFRAKREECRQNTLKCACCAGMSAEEILAAKAENGGSSRPSSAAGGGGPAGRPGMGAAGGGGSRPQGSGGGSAGSFTIDEETLAERCPSFLDQCGNMPVDLDCTPYDSVTSITKESRSNLLYCRCCVD